LANADEEIREELRAKIYEMTNIHIERPVCRGCRNEDGKIPVLKAVQSEPCNVYRCIQEKGLDFCCECDDFPCDHLHPYADMAPHVPHNTKVFNLCLIKKMGLERWAEEKARSVKDTYFDGKWKL
jgi:hypothetical protein